MIKFAGKGKCLKEFLGELIKFYGGKTTIKEVYQMLGALKNANM